ncbi:MAG TPA: HAMP domain-containing sensor histidine kinase [Flavipsychrobacter sp.]|jgi:K+-sensing histidine kinase KdpD|nr:HAMP domain-containing sensor histidine kinase [Flavipsychrobacter sp.]
MLLNIPWYQNGWLILAISITALGYISLVLFLRAKRFIIRQNVLRALVERKTKEIRRKNEELEKNDLIKTRLISIISHDIITPLKFLHLAGRNLVESHEQMTDELKMETLEEIVHTARELEMLSTNILNWIKYQNENRQLGREEVRLNEMVRNIFSILNGMAKQKNIFLTNEVPEDFTIRQYAEPLRIIIYNLVVNALNFMEKGHITIVAKQLRNGMLIEVKDQGFGMTKEQINNILADQFIVSSANVDGKKGNGLGYLIIKDLLRVVEGNFSIKSAKNIGTTIKLFFPKQ